ncbi:Orange carotenoid protein [Leptolyngbya sp. FACHB-36]|uniref:orange carotenoid protein N-terminal domain-containing protein n=1 Tax=Leptolyngbya sp. FACHB-36 TaxID=2692808 RepID=UPI001681005E|nr:orange carotenoid protein N-terminal domain-containing protein [Leptolyngbya sp. FACHB-36]MBD2018720.1 Orange carotenoid protein [Leptolyngbya sp. FACHB-36]
MTFVSSNTANEQLGAFQSLDVDEQLALFYFIYKEMGHSITPAAPGASTVSPTIAEALFNQVKDKSHEEQLQIQRDLIQRKNSLLAREYGALGDTTKLLFWYLLSQGMDNGTIIPLPPNYELSSEAKSLFEQIKGLDFSQQITLFRDYVAPMGVDPATAEHDSETGL